MRTEEELVHQSSGLDHADGWRIGAIIGLGLVGTLVQAILGVGYVLDDWYAVRNVAFGGAMNAADEGLRMSRPGAAVTFGLAFGYADNQYAMLFVRMGLLLAAAVLGYLLLRRFFPREVPFAVIALWLVLPNHMSLEFWPSALVATASLVALLAGCLLLCGARLGWSRLAAVSALFAFAVLTYESSALPAAVAAVVLPWVVSGRLQRRAVGVVFAALAATTLWSLTHWHGVKSVQNDVVRYADVVHAHFGWGILPHGFVANVGMLLGVIGVTLVLARVMLPSLRLNLGPADWLVISGLAVMILGSVTFALYYYAPLGAGDRVNYASALGGAMVMVGLLWMVWSRWRVVAAVLASLVLVGALTARVERTRTWVRAGADADRIVEAIKLTDPSCDVVVLGPAPIQRENVAAFLDQSNVDGAVQVALGRQNVRGVMTFDEQTFDRAPAECRVDIRPLSELEPDVVVGPA